MGLQLYTLPKIQRVRQNFKLQHREGHIRNFNFHTASMHKHGTITKLSLRFLVRPLHELVEIEFIERLLLLLIGMTRKRDANVRQS